jgi:hypothetical protein
MTAPVIKKNEEISDQSNRGEARLSPSLPTPLPLRFVLMPSGFLNKRDPLPPSKPLRIMGNAEMVSILQQALDLTSDCCSDCSDDEGEL